MPLASVMPPDYSGYFMAEKVIFFLTLFGSLTSLGWMLARHHRSRSELLRQHLALREQVVLQAGSLEAYLAFARTEEGRKLLASPSLERPLLSGLRFLQGGMVCLPLGILWLVFRGWGQALVFGGTGLGLILAGLLTRMLEARWVAREAQD